jgi:pimeloyl-ACP methyl ester carboxylesterase
MVLVHPAWHGGWVWKKVVPLLGQGGHRTYTPTLTGLGERSHLAHRGIRLETHVRDVVQVLEYEDLEDAVLVGHSSSGAVITGVAELVPRRVGRLVYLDAFVPEDGQSVFDLLSPERRKVLEGLVRTEGDGWLLPRFAPAPWETIVRDSWEVTDDADARWLLSRLCATPVSHFADPVTRKDPLAAGRPRAYVRCRRFANPRMDQHAAMARSAAGWILRELDTGHHPAITAPHEVARLLLELAS